MFIREGIYVAFLHLNRVMHNVYAMGGTVKSISQLANTLAEKGHQVTIISVFKSNDYPYFQLHESIKIKPLINYQLRLSNLWDIIFNRINKYTSFTRFRPGSNFDNSFGLVNEVYLFIRLKIISHKFDSLS